MTVAEEQPFVEGDGRQGLVRHCWYPVEVLGPGKRFGVWFQGCSRRCPDCFSQHTREFDCRFAIPLEELVTRMRKAALFTDRLTISGGEPFDQPRFLYHFLEAARAEGVRDILVYSGFEWEILQRVPIMSRALGLIDALIDGSFRSDMPTRRCWRGSANQRLLVLSKNAEIRDRYLGFVDADETESRMQLAQDGGEDFVIGIPREPIPPEDLRSGKG